MKNNRFELLRRDRRWRGPSGPPGRISRQADRANGVRLEMARMLYGGHGR